MKYPVEHLWFPKAAVETVAKFRQVAGQMLGADAVVDTPDIAFDIGDQGMDPGQDLDRLFSRTGHQPLVSGGGAVQEAIPLPTVSFDHHLGRQAVPHQGLNLLAADPVNHPHRGKPWLGFRGFHGHHHLGLAGGAASTFTGFGSPEVGVVHLDQASQFIVGVPCSHGLANLVPHGPHRLVRLDLQHPLQGQHGDAAFLASHQPDHPEPLGQGGSGLVKHAASGQGSLVAAGLTVIEVASPVEIGRTMLAAGTPKPLRPAQTKQMLLAGFLGAKLFLKLPQTEGFLLPRLAPIR